MNKFDRICRTCNTETSRLLNLSTTRSSDTGLTLADLLASVCPLLACINDERFPQNICILCSKQMEIAYEFQMQCIKSHENLCNIINETEITIKNEDIETTNAENEDEYSILETEKLEILDDYDADTMQSEEYEPPQQPPEIQLPPAEKEQPMHECWHCEKKFLTSSGLQLHMKLTHKNLKPVSVLVNAEILTIECKYCHEVFEEKSELWTHYTLKHKKEMANDLTCDVCHKSFAEKSRYKHHLLYHGKTRHMCTVKDCNKGFIVKYKLLDHLKRHHGINPNLEQAKAVISVTMDDDAEEC